MKGTIRKMFKIRIPMFLRYLIILYYRVTLKISKKSLVRKFMVRLANTVQ